jgi:hypothetical protein
MQASMMQKKGHECGVGGGMGPGTIIARNESVCPIKVEEAEYVQKENGHFIQC